MTFFMSTFVDEKSAANNILHDIFIQITHYCLEMSRITIRVHIRYYQKLEGYRYLLFLGKATANCRIRCDKLYINYLGGMAGDTERYENYFM